MAKRFALPEHHVPRFNCPKCGAFAAQEWRRLSYPAGQDEMGHQYYEPVRDNIGGDWEASLCAGCDDHSLWLDGELTYPADRPGLEVPEPVEGMPQDVEKLYLEASAVLPHSSRAAAALCRASLERLSKTLTPEMNPTASLDERLIVLSEKTTAALAKGVQIIRHAGNTALHGARDDDASVVIYMDGSESDLIDLFFVTINELVDELITRPARIQSVYELLPEQKRYAIERKMAASKGRR
ncbi:DUF4145 domain-containing protein [Arthrobacter sp. NPDC056493]|uniref:DUF4145 domain-containing protein n=1 Tax=Arthrobacter sp. NPDC056493 TaxID=3345839 RepID=UPI00366ECF63